MGWRKVQEQVAQTWRPAERRTRMGRPHIYSRSGDSVMLTLQAVYNLALCRQNDTVFIFAVKTRDIVFDKILFLFIIRLF